jgi:hypothetical protein
MCKDSFRNHQCVAYVPPPGAPAPRNPVTSCAFCKNVHKKCVPAPAAVHKLLKALVKAAAKYNAHDPVSVRA